MSFESEYLKEIIKEVKSYDPSINIKQAWTHKTGNQWEFHYKTFYWYGRAENAIDAKAKGWEAFLRKHRITNPSRVRQNPGTLENAETLSREFHGREPRYIEDIVETYKYPKALTILGKLTELEILDIEGDYATPVEFKNKQPDLCSTPDGKQLVLVGGDQKLKLSDMGLETNGKQYVDLGYLHTLSYYTDKHHLEGGGEKGSEYIHELGEESGEKPMAVYDCLNNVILIVGGAYHVEDRGIVN